MEPLTEMSGESEISVEVSNQSDQTWSSGGPNPVNISYHWLDEDWNMVVFDGVRTSLPDEGIQPGETKTVLSQVRAPSAVGTYHLVMTQVREGSEWFDVKPDFKFSVRRIRVVDKLEPVERIKMTISCRDCDSVPKVADAGRILEENGTRIQIMHEGTRVLAGGYHGQWMEQVISSLKGHHEPQEEAAFHSILKHVQPHSLMVELGCFWAYYTNWFLGAIPEGKAICIEPDEKSLEVGRQNLRLNHRTAKLINACIGDEYRPTYELQRESDGAIVSVPMWDLEKVLECCDGECIEVLHMDTQGAELPFLKSFHVASWEGRIRFIVISTHHASISGSSSTHRDCLKELIALGAHILCEHSVDTSFSGDGLIVANFHENDKNIRLPQISHNDPGKSLFGPDRMSNELVTTLSFS
jgi:FkbM family methyltransferase